MEGDFMVEYGFEPENRRSVAVDDGHVIGLCEYKVQDGKWYITHTEVDPVYGGRGIARQLVLMVAEEARKAQCDVVPICSYAVKVLG